KLERLNFFGIRNVLLIDFSAEFSKMTGSDFFTVLFNNFKIKKVVAGHNFNLGRNKSMDVAGLKKILGGIELEIIEPEEYDGKIISSSRIRTDIAEGNFTNVKAMLQTEYTIDLTESILRRLKTSGFILEKDKIHQIIPKTGNYKGNVLANEIKYPCDIEITEQTIKLVLPEINIANNRIDYLYFM
ncbi:MAG: hypothetical protein JW969_11695, partial [Spirochaetales bacterium]|nr:hypothetical protein [Spirochaetales bacterium]